MHPLIEWLKGKQQAQGLTDEQFAKKLGYPNRTSWTMYKLGQRTGPTFQLVRGALVAFPDEREKVLSFVLGVTIVPPGASKGPAEVYRQAARG